MQNVYVQNSSAKYKKRQEDLRRITAELMSKKSLDIDEDGIEILGIRREIEIVEAKSEVVDISTSGKRRHDNDPPSATNVPQAGPSRSRSRSNFTAYRASKLSSVSAPYKNTLDEAIVVTDSDEDVVEVSDEHVQKRPRISSTQYYQTSQASSSRVRPQSQAPQPSLKRKMSLSVEVSDRRLSGTGMVIDIPSSDDEDSREVQRKKEENRRRVEYKKKQEEEDQEKEREQAEENRRRMQKTRAEEEETRLKVKEKENQRVAQRKSAEGETNQRLKKKQQDEEEDEEYRTTLPVCDASMWEPLPQRSEVSDLGTEFARIQLDTPPPRNKSDIRHHSGRFKPAEIGAPWDEPQPLHLFCEALRKRVAKLPRSRPQDHRSGFRQIRATAATFVSKQSAGAVNKILQNKDYTFIASSVTGGERDAPPNADPPESFNPYNKLGTLVVWNGLEPLVLNGHSRQAPFPKNYTINDIAICPTTDGDYLTISTANDYLVKFWKPQQRNSTHQVSYKRPPSPLNATPMDIAVKSGEPLFAVAAQQVVIHSEHNSDWRPQPLRLVADEDGNRAGSITWGSGATSSLLFASSEGSTEDIPVGPASHKAFDIARQAPSITFDLQEDGDGLAVDPSGDRLVIFTVQHGPPVDEDATGEEKDTDTRTLRLYDVRRKDGRDVLRMTLEKAEKRGGSEVKSASFSPDGIYLAVGRGDGRIHIYDSRNFDELLYDFRHDGPSRVFPGNGDYGIVHMEWRNLHHNRLGLLSGGPDGCVRLWQPHLARRSRQQGRIIAQVNADVGYFTMGDRFKNEHDLVVGDGDGEVSFFDNLGNI